MGVAPVCQHKLAVRSHAWLPPQYVCSPTAPKRQRPRVTKPLPVSSFMAVTDPSVTPDVFDMGDDLGPDRIRKVAHPTVTPASRSWRTAASPSPGLRLTGAVAARSTVVSNPSRAESRAVSFTQ